LCEAFAPAFSFDAVSEPVAEVPTVGLMKLAKNSGLEALVQYLWEKSGVDEVADEARPDTADSETVMPPDEVCTAVTSSSSSLSSSSSCGLSGPGSSSLRSDRRLPGQCGVARDCAPPRGRLEDKKSWPWPWP